MASEQERLGEVRSARLSRLVGIRHRPSTDPEDPAADDYLYRAGELLTREEDRPRVQETLQGLGIRYRTCEVGDSLVQLNLVDGWRVPEALDRLDERLGPGVVTCNHCFTVAPKHTFGPGAEPRVPPKAASPQAATRERAGSRIRVGVVDSGLLVEPALPGWLQAQAVAAPEDREDPFGPDGRIEFDAGHGTFVTGVIELLAPGASQTAQQIVDRLGVFTEVELGQQIADALNRPEGPPHLLNLSLGGYTRGDLIPLGLAAPLADLGRRHPDTLVVAAAGNDTTSRRFYPAAHDEVIAVGAVDQTGARAQFSNFGDWVQCWAPGVDLLSAYPTGTYRTALAPHVDRVFTGTACWSGTSFAAPVVTAAIAAQMSRDGTADPRAAWNKLLGAARSTSEGPLIWPDGVERLFCSAALR